jgi:signal transduction histidine kinase
VLGLQPAEVLPVRTINRLATAGQRPLFDGSRGSEGETFYSEIRVTRADDGRERWIAQRGETVRDNDLGGVRRVGVIYDITEPRQAREDLQKLNDTLEVRVAEEVASRLEVEEALRQAQKMEAVGQLTGGIAHDFNNLLTVIMGNLDMAVRRLGATGDDRVDRALAHAMKGASRASTLTQRLLAFSRRQPLDPKRIDISRLLHGMADMLGRTLGETIAFDTEIENALWHVEIDPNQLENAVLNLAVNGRDAMDGNGSLLITAHNETVVAPSAAGPSPGDYVRLSVCDPGSGMNEDTIARAFDPFYTTKDVGKGTGLGLSIVYGFVTQSGGHVDILSSPGAGTTVRLFLPRMLGASTVETDVAVFETEQGLSETVLVVEDDEDVRAYAVEGLRHLGYQVFEAADGPSALALLKNECHLIRFLLSDVIMAGMSGRDLVD